jgi:hypothetical protein
MSVLQRLRSPGSWFARLRSSIPALQAAGVAAAAGGLVALLAPRWGVFLAVLTVPAAVGVGLGARWNRTWPSVLAFGALGAGHCMAVVSRPVDVLATAIVAVALFAAFQFAAGSSGQMSGRSPTSMALVMLAASSGPIVLVLARGVGGVPVHLYLPALAAGVGAVAAPVLIATRRLVVRRPEEDAADL